MRRHYKIDKAQDFRKIRTEVVIASVLGILLIVGITYVVFDLNNSKVSIDESQNYATLGTVESRTAEYTVVETDKYTMKIPADWRRINNPEVIVNGARYYPERFQGTTGDDVGRRVDVYFRDTPYQLGVNKVQKVIAIGRKMSASTISGQCYRFTEYPKEQPGDDYPSTWEDIEFTCNTSEITNVVGAIQSSQAKGVELDTQYGLESFFLVYTDHGSSQNNGIFKDILESFEAK